MNILLISDCHHFSTQHVYDGYVEGFKKLNIKFDTVPLHELVKIHSLDYAWALASAKLLNVENKFTHCAIISGMMVPEWFLKSKYDKKMFVIAVDDPHASKVIADKQSLYDYWFTNEKTLEDESKKIFYLPTATSAMLPTVSRNDLEDKFRNDVVFVGTVYDDRVPVLEAVAKYCDEKKLKFSIYGRGEFPEDGYAKKYHKNGVIENTDAKLLYRGASVVLNLDRNVEWNIQSKNGNPLLYGSTDPYSMNPRAYEIAGCHSTQLFINPRKEVADVFGDNVYTCNEKEISSKLDEIFQEKEEDKIEKINNCFNIIRKSHLYVHRANALINYLKGVEYVD